MSNQKWYNLFPRTNFGQANLDWLLEHFGDLDDRLKKTEDKNIEQDGRLDQDEADIADLRADLTAETNARIAADNAEKTAREAADRQIELDLAAETSARIAADNGLSDRITTEVGARIAGDSALGTRIDNEATARANADTALGNRIDALETVIIRFSDADPANPAILPADVSKAAAMFDPEKNVILNHVESEAYFERNQLEVHSGAEQARFTYCKAAESVNHGAYGYLPEVQCLTITATRTGGTGTPTLTKDYVAIPDLEDVVTGIPVVVANPSETGSTNLSKLKVGSTVYNVPQGGGGSSVVANDNTGTPGGNLTSLKVDGVSYDVPTGSGSAKNVLYIFLDSYATNAYRVRYAWCAYGVNPTANDWANAVTSVSGVSPFVVTLQRAMADANTDIVFIDAINYTKADDTNFDVTDVTSLALSNGSAVPLIYPEIITSRYSGNNTERATFKWEGHVLKADYTETSPNVYEGVIVYENVEGGEPGDFRIDNDGYVIEYDEEYTPSYVGYTKLTRNLDSTIYYQNTTFIYAYPHPYSGVDERAVLYKAVTAADTTGYTEKTLLIVMDETTTPFRMKLAKVITETHS